MHCSNGNDPYCLGRCQNNICQACIHSFNDSSTGVCTTVSNQVEGCFFYDPDGKCKNCRLGYLSLIEGTCVKNYIKFCLVQKNFEECLLCENGLIKNGDCLQTDTCEEIDPNCIACYYQSDILNNSVNSQTGVTQDSVLKTTG